MESVDGEANDESETEDESAFRSPMRPESPQNEDNEANRENGPNEAAQSENDDVVVEEIAEIVVGDDDDNNELESNDIENINPDNVRRTVLSEIAPVLQVSIVPVLPDQLKTLTKFKDTDNSPKGMILNF